MVQYLHLLDPEIPIDMILVYKILQNWVILGKGKCWCAYSSTMVRIWEMVSKVF